MDANEKACHPECKAPDLAKELTATATEAVLYRKTLERIARIRSDAAHSGRRGSTGFALTLAIDLARTTLDEADNLP